MNYKYKEKSYTIQKASRGFRFLTFVFLKSVGVNPVMFRNCDDKC